MQKKFLTKAHFNDLIQLLINQGYDVVGPQVKDSAIVYDKLDSSEQFPIGIQDDQTPGSYSLLKIDNSRWFSWANGPQALKPMMFSPQETLWSAKKNAQDEIQFIDGISESAPLAVIGVRACDLSALAIQDKHFLESDFQDPYYRSRRENLLLIAVNCSHPAQTCFCVATGNGPEVKCGYDLVLTELAEGFLISAGTVRGDELVQKLNLESVTEENLLLEKQQVDNAIKSQSRVIPETKSLKNLINQLEHSQWDEIAKRCLSCGNCTAVCPTCFCHSEVDKPTLNGDQSDHVRMWDSCFSQQHSYIHGIVIRAETKTRYRQWLTHKFSSWFAQYGQSGCVGCGRCISWCPVGIDVTEELAVICE